MSPPSPDPTDPDPDPRPTRGPVRVGVTLLIVVVALLGVWLSDVTGRLDTALLFVGVPCLIAFGLSRLPGDGGWFSVVNATTIVLLLASALLHEGALCVLLASPLVYGVVLLIYWLSELGSTERYAIAPFVVLLALEGVLPGARVAPDQDASASRVVADQCADFRAALVRGPRIDPDDDRGLLLQLAEYPTPVAASGSGIEPGDTWELTMPSGAITTEVVTAAPSRLTFTIVDDTARTTRWVDLAGGSLEWKQTTEGCVATMTIDYERRLDPSWWFGPVTELFMNAGADAFLSGLD